LAGMALHRRDGGERHRDGRGIFPVVG
jgi:hypothetical protein